MRLINVIIPLWDGNDDDNDEDDDDTQAVVDHYLRQ